MADTELKTNHAVAEDAGGHDLPGHLASEVGTGKPRRRIVPILITLATIAVAIPLGWAMWNAYMAAPWTRDGTVRVHVVTMAPEISGRIVELPVVDNQFVHKGDLLLAIDPTNYKSPSNWQMRRSRRRRPLQITRSARLNAGANSTTYRSRWSRNR